MKNYFLALALLAAGGTARAQVSKFSLGLSLGRVPLRATAPEHAAQAVYGTGQYPAGYVLKSYASSYWLPGFNLGFDAPLWQFAGGEQALGLSLNAGLSGFKATDSAVEGFDGGLLGDFPEYVTYRYGAKASKHAKHDFGLGVGLGYRYGYFAVPFHAPSAMLEGVLSGSRSDWFLRLSADLRPTRYYDYYSSEGLVEVLRIQEFNLLLGYSF